MSAPRELDQRWMVAALQRATSLAADEGMIGEVSAYIAAGPRLSPTEQLEIYREQFFLRHIGSLVEDFPGVRRLVGEDAFHDLAVRYLAAHPPETFTLRDLGVRFPAFVRASPALANHGAASDMASVEWAFVEVFDAAGAARIAPARLASVPAEAWDTAVLTLHPTLRLLSLDWPVHRMRERVIAGEAADVPDAEPVCVAIFRDDLQLRYDELEPAAHALLELLAAGTPLGPACEVIAARWFSEEPSAVSGALSAWFARWTALGWIVDIGHP